MSGARDEIEVKVRVEAPDPAMERTGRPARVAGKAQ